METNKKNTNNIKDSNKDSNKDKDRKRKQVILGALAPSNKVNVAFKTEDGDTVHLSNKDMKHAKEVQKSLTNPN